MPETRQEQLRLAYGNTELDYTLLRANRKTLAVEVHPDLSIVVKAPQETEFPIIEKALLNKARWIVKQQAFFETFLPQTPPREYVSGETHLYLGKRYILHVKESEAISVKLSGGYLQVNTNRKKSDTQFVKRLLAQWYKSHAERVFTKRLNLCLPLFKKYDLTIPALEIRRMPKRWGSYTPKGKILLNPELIKAPTKCIDYVLIHELCHAVYPNHNKKFYQLQEALNPGWDKWKISLERLI
ncbi:MAG: SprT family zinc-dependent metalloprotease [Cyclobacteriaceae bacterium]